MKRRSLIKAVAAGSLTAATPLACLLARNALAAGNTAPIRTIFLFHPNGCVPDIFFPKAGSRTLPAMTAPLQSVYDNLVFIDGIGYAGPDYTHEGGAFKCLTGRMTRDDKFSSIDVLMGKEDWANRASNGISVPSVQMGVAPPSIPSATRASCTRVYSAAAPAQPAWKPKCCPLPKTI
jgi:hypothetical protein